MALSRLPSSRCGWATATRSTRYPRVDTFTEHLSLAAGHGSSWPAASCSRCPTWRWSPTTASISSSSSYRLGEMSDSTVGLTHRWIIKGVYAAGLWMVVAGILSVLLRVIAFLFGEVGPENSQPANRPYGLTDV